MSALQQTFARVWNSAVAWSWVFNGLRLGSALILLPLLVRKLSVADLGMHYVLLSLGAVAILFDFGFRSAIWRGVCVALAGGNKLEKQGLARIESASEKPNRALLHDVIAAARQLYRLIALGAFVVIGGIGTAVVATRVQETSNPTITWIAWTLTLLAAAWEVYAGWWNEILNGMNRVRESARISVLSYSVRLALSAGLLLAGFGLPSVGAAALVASTLERLLARRLCLRLLPARPAASSAIGWQELIGQLWPNAWRQGLVSIGTYCSAHANSIVCLAFIGLTANSEFGLSLQLMMVAQGMANVWTQVKWPLIGQLQAKRDYPAIRQMLRQRLWLQTLTYVLLVTAAIPLAQPALVWLGSDKEVLPVAMLVILAVNGLLEMHLSAWGALIATQNRIPLLWPLLISNATSIILAIALIQFAGYGLLSLLIAPLSIGLLFNYWYWPAHGARSIDTTWVRLLFLRS